MSLSSAVAQGPVWYWTRAPGTGHQASCRLPGPGFPWMSHHRPEQSRSSDSSHSDDSSGKTCSPLPHRTGRAAFGGEVRLSLPSLDRPSTTIPSHLFQHEVATCLGVKSLILSFRQKSGCWGDEVRAARVALSLSVPQGHCPRNVCSCRSLRPAGRLRHLLPVPSPPVPTSTGRAPCTMSGFTHRAGAPPFCPLCPATSVTLRFLHEWHTRGADAWGGRGPRTGRRGPRPTPAEGGCLPHTQTAWGPACVGSEDGVAAPGAPAGAPRSRVCLLEQEAPLPGPVPVSRAPAGTQAADRSLEGKGQRRVQTRQGAQCAARARLAPRRPSWGSARRLLVSLHFLYHQRIKMKTSRFLFYGRRSPATMAHWGSGDRFAHGSVARGPGRGCDSAGTHARSCRPPRQNPSPLASCPPAHQHRGRCRSPERLPRALHAGSVPGAQRPSPDTPRTAAHACFYRLLGGQAPKTHPGWSLKARLEKRLAQDQTFPWNWQ